MDIVALLEVLVKGLLDAENKGRSALLSVQFTLDKTAVLFRNSVGIHHCHFSPDFAPVSNSHRPFFCSLKSRQIKGF